MNYNKLVRDKIPLYIEAVGKKANVIELDDEQFVLASDIKFEEELKEYFAAETDEEQVEELADIVELVYAVLEQKGVSIAEFEKVRLNKKNERGGFRKRLFLVSVDDGDEVK